MSIWGPGADENDDAADWFSDLEDAPNFEMVRNAILEISDPAHAGYHEVTECCEAVAAAEVICELLGKPGDPAVLDLDEDGFAQLKSTAERENARGNGKLVRQALFAVEFVMNDEDNSELRQLWEEDKQGLEAWTAVMKGLQARLEELVPGTR